MVQDMKRIVIIGGGASGLSAAIEAGRAIELTGMPVEVIVLERNPRVGKKLLLTGNGRCNLTNTNLFPDAYNTPRALSVIHALTEDTRTFFTSLGIMTCCDEAGRVYPHSMQSGSILNALRGEAERLGVQICTSSMVESVRRKDGRFLLDEGIFADAVIMACGGCAYPVTGSDGNGYKLLQSLGIPYTRALPSLTGLEVADRDFKALKGVRAKAVVTAHIDGKAVASEHGEVQFTEYGVSGIAVMQLSRLITRALGRDKHCEPLLTIDLAPDVEWGQIVDFLRHLCERKPKMLTADLLAGIVPRQLGFYLLKRCRIPIGENTCDSIPHKIVPSIAGQIKAFRLQIVSVRGFEQAQVTAGGAKLSAFNSYLMARQVAGLFACGEILNVDGMCGGYNLEWAFSSGRLCGKSAVDFLIGEAL